jgi:hypothetical protein
LDTDQAIYGFRQGDPAALGTFSQAYGADNNLELSGNFRSSPAICRCAATLRSRAEPDQALGENAAVTLPVYVLKYEGNTPPASIHLYFNNLCQQVHRRASANCSRARAYVRPQRVRPQYRFRRRRFQGRETGEGDRYLPR